MHLIKNNKILSYIILLAILIYFYYKTNNEEHMLGIDLTPNKILFYNFLCKYFDVKNINTKKDTYWYDPIEFNNKIYLYSLYVIAILQIVKKNITRIE